MRTRASVASKASRHFVFGVILITLSANAPQPVLAQGVPESMSMPAFAPAMLKHMRKMRRYKDHDHGAQHTSHVIDRFRVDQDPKGVIASFQPNGATFTANNAFFKDMGTNGRTCFTCHQPQNGWGISAKDVAERFERSAGTDPIFRLVDGATCPSHDISTVRAKKARLQTADGERPASRRACGSNDGGIRHHGHPRPLWLQHQSGNRLGHSIDVPAPPVTNVSFLSTVMWDGRENTGKGLAADLKSQTRDATLGHAQGRCIANRRPAG